MQRQMLNEYPWQPQVRDNQGKEKTIEPLDVFCFLLGHLLQIIVCLVLGAVIGVAYTIFNTDTTPQYQSTAQIYVKNPVRSADDVIEILSKLSDDNVLVSQVADTISRWESQPSVDSMIEDYTVMLLSQPLLQEVVENLSLDINPAVLENMVTVSRLGNSHVIEITVTALNAQEAEDIIGEVISQGEIYFRNFVEEEPPALLGDIKTTGYQPSVNVSKSAVLAGLITAILYSGFILARFLMDDTVVTPDDVVECFGVQPLATIPVSDLGEVHKCKMRKAR